jgi:hypothetical protein
MWMFSWSLRDENRRSDFTTRCWPTEAAVWVGNFNYLAIKLQNAMQSTDVRLLLKINEQAGLFLSSLVMSLFLFLLPAFLLGPHFVSISTAWQIIREPFPHRSLVSQCARHSPFSVFPLLSRVCIFV